MTPRLPVPLFATLLLMALGTIAAACGDGGLTLEKYLQQVEAADDEAEARSDALEDQFPTAFEEPGATRDFFNAFAAIFRDFVDDLNDIEPTAEVEDAHNEFADAAEELAASFDELAGRAADAETLEELLTALFTSELSAAGDRFEVACLDLQGIADANAIDADLEC